MDELYKLPACISSRLNQIYIFSKLACANNTVSAFIAVKLCVTPSPAKQGIGVRMASQKNYLTGPSIGFSFFHVGFESYNVMIGFCMNGVEVLTGRMKPVEF